MTEKKTDEVSATHKPDEAAKPTRCEADASRIAEPRITNTQKEKDPRKVEAGKKLGAISKLAKNQKKYKAEAHGYEAQSSDNNQNLDYSSFFYAGLAVVVGCLGVLYWNSQKPQEVPRSASEAPEPPKFRTSLTHSNLISLDD